MADAATFKTLGDWKAGIEIPLERALAVSMDVMGRDGKQACKHALILMAQSARAMTKIAKKNRPVTINPGFRHLLSKAGYKAAKARGDRMSDYYKYTADKLGQPPKTLTVLYANEKSKIAKIGNRGLGQRSWMWGLGKLGSGGASNEIPGVNTVFQWYSPSGTKHAAGFEMHNALSYVQQAMPGNWPTEVEGKAVNKMLAQCRNRMPSWMKAVGAV